MIKTDYRYIYYSKPFTNLISLHRALYNHHIPTLESFDNLNANHNDESIIQFPAVYSNRVNTKLRHEVIPKPLIMF